MDPHYIVPAFHHLGAAKSRAKSLKSLGKKSILLVNDDSTVDYSGCADEIVKVANIKSAYEIADALSATGLALAGFISAQDRIWPSIFEASRMLGIPFRNLEGQVNCRIKPLMREKTRHLLNCDFAVINQKELNEPMVDSLVERFGLPLMLKPIWGQGSSLVSLVSHREEAIKRITSVFRSLKKEPHLRAFEWEAVTWDPKAQLLVEPALKGTEFLFDGYVQDGRFVKLVMAEKMPMEWKDGILCETGVFSNTPNLSADENKFIEERLKACVEAVGLTDSFFHIEFFWDGKDVQLVEINPRTAGGGAPFMILLNNGIEVSDWYMSLMLGEPLPEKLSYSSEHTLFSICATPHFGKIAAIDGADWTRQQPEFKGCHQPTPIGGLVPYSGGEYYVYEAAYMSSDFERIMDLHRETQKRVKVVFEEQPSSQNA